MRFKTEKKHGACRLGRSYLCFNNVYNFVPSCTGATRKVVGGRIAPGENFHSVRLTNTAV